MKSALETLEWDVFEKQLMKSGFSEAEVVVLRGVLKAHFVSRAEIKKVLVARMRKWKRTSATEDGYNFRKRMEVMRIAELLGLKVDVEEELLK